MQVLKKNTWITQCEYPSYISLTCGVGFLLSSQALPLILAKECTGRGLVEEHSAGGVFSILCWTAGLQWDRQRKLG